MPAKAPTRAQRPRLSREEVRGRLMDAATELVRDRSFYELSVAELTERAGIERTIFYRHFDDLADLLLRAATEAASDGWFCPSARSAKHPAAPADRRRHS